MFFFLCVCGVGRLYIIRWHFTEVTSNNYMFHYSDFPFSSLGSGKAFTWLELNTVHVHGVCLAQKRWPQLAFSTVTSDVVTFKIEKLLVSAIGGIYYSCIDFFFSLKEKKQIFCLADGSVIGQILFEIFCLSKFNSCSPDTPGCSSVLLLISQGLEQITVKNKTKRSIRN